MDVSYRQVPPTPKAWPSPTGTAGVVKRPCGGISSREPHQPMREECKGAPVWAYWVIFTPATALVLFFVAMAIFR